MASCKNCGHNSAFHSDQAGKPNCCIECKEQKRKCKGFEVKVRYMKK